MSAQAERFSVVSFTRIAPNYFTVRLAMSPGNERRGIMGIRVNEGGVTIIEDTLIISDAVNRPAGVHLTAELSLQDGRGWIAYP